MKKRKTQVKAHAGVRKTRKSTARKTKSHDFFAEVTMGPYQLPPLFFPKKAGK